MTSATRTATRHPMLTDTALLLIRLVLGVVFVFHGSQKVFGAFDGPGIEGFAGYLASLHVPLPTIGAWLSALTELIGGLSLLTGFGLRIMAVPLAINMAVAVITVHHGAFSVQNGGMEYPLTVGVTIVALGLAGAGRFSLDALFFPRKEIRAV